ncbi:MAG: imidazoleglycerol-phosphate dehydratase HisB [Candidatus Sumerlaeota bacterium]|nr:imidazoleglycerol-phosphate dehydratase HisB [Candidatus Sumerlaeota bacterium]
MTPVQPRIGEVERKTKETDLRVRVNLDGEGRFEGGVGIPFFEHMLDSLARHGRIDLTVQGKGDVRVDPHHTVEDVGICLGQALAKALGDRAGIARYGEARVPMEEALAEAILDICNRPFLRFEAELTREKLGDYDVELTEDFFRAVCANAGLTLHLRAIYGRNAHHVTEALFKAFARALGEAARIDPRSEGKPLSTKGVL